MPSRPVIGITCSSHTPSNGEAPHDRLNHAYSHSVWLAGGVPFVLPNIDDETHGAAALRNLDGLVLSGGGDVAPAQYREAPWNDTVSPDALRDASELPLIRVAVRMNLPILAICRGIQSLNVALGGTLWQDLPTQAPGGIAHRQAAARDVATHAITVAPDSLLAQIIGAELLEVNSFHHQAVRDVAAGLRVTARAPDGIIEAIESPAHRFVLGVQFHPEEMFCTSVQCRRLFEALIQACTTIQ